MSTLAMLVLCQTSESALLLMLQQMAVRLELLDERECKWVLMNPMNFRHDLGVILQRWEELKDAPPVRDAERWPSRDACAAALEQNSRYRNHLENRQTMDPGIEARDLTAAIRETNYLWQVWDNLRDAANESYYVHTRRAALARVRDLLGHEAYITGELPPPVPLWRFAHHDSRIPEITR